MKKRLIATDFDGTFCRGGKIAEEDRAAIAAWRAAGGLFGFVTGRGDDFFRLTRELKLDVDFHLLYNGALLALPDGAPVKEYMIPRHTVAALADLFRELPDARYFDEPDDRAFYHQYYGGVRSDERAVETAALINGRFGNDVIAFVNGWDINVGKKGSGKARGVYDALEYFGLPADAAAVFGDNLNDLEMIVSHRGWAVDTARPEVLATTPHVCASVGEAARALLAEAPA